MQALRNRDKMKDDAIDKLQYQLCSTMEFRQPGYKTARMIYDILTFTEPAVSHFN